MPAPTRAPRRLPSPRRSSRFWSDSVRGSAQLTVRNADGRSHGRSATCRSRRRRLSSSPDGREAVFDHGLGEGTGQLEVIDLSTGAARHDLHVGQPQGPDWSPDGSTIVVLHRFRGALHDPVRWSRSGDAGARRGRRAVPRGLSGHVVARRRRRSWPSTRTVTSSIVEVDGDPPHDVSRRSGDAGWTDWGRDGHRGLDHARRRRRQLLYLLDPENGSTRARCPMHRETRSAPRSLPTGRSSRSWATTGTSRTCT